MDKKHDRPVNKMAAMGLSKGVQFWPKKKLNGLHFQNRPNIKKPVKNSPDFTGEKVGRMTVIGLSADVPKRWVCRCPCGHYELRTAKAIKNPKNNKDACDYCLHLEYQKRVTEYRAYGRNIQYT